MRKTDIIGKTFGRLTAIEEISIINTYNGKKKKETRVKCKCSCGNMHEVTKGALISGNTKSCGCFKREKMASISREYHTLPFGNASMNALYSSYRSGAKYRGLEFDISKEDFRAITSSNCFYCGAEPSQYANKKLNKYSRKLSKKYNGNYIYNGIDRIDNSLGYIVGNVVPCCKRCNRGKLDITTPEFYSWIKKVHENLSRNNFQLPTGISFKNPSG